MSDKDNTANWIESLSNEMIGAVVKQLVSGDIGNLQNKGRVVAERLFSRNAIFAAKVQQNYRVNIPQAEVEKLDLESGDLVQVVLTPVETEVSDDQS